VSSDYIDICYDLMKPYTCMLYLTYLLPCELESHTSSRGDYNCTKKKLLVVLSCRVFFSPLLFAVHCQGKNILQKPYKDEMYLNTTLPTTLSSLQFENKLQKEREEELMKRRKIYCPCLHKRRADLLVISCFFVPRNWGAPAFLLKTLKWGMALKDQPFDLVDPFRQSLIFWWEKWVSGRGCCWAASASTT